MAPSAEEWDALSPAERAAVVAALPGEVTYDEMAMPEGDRHFKAKARAFDALRGYFTRQRRRVYLALELPVYYPNDRFAPDLLAVLDAAPDARVYSPIVPNHGLYESRVLGLDVQVDEDRLRFYDSTALLLETPERIARVQAMYDAAQRRADEEARGRCHWADQWTETPPRTRRGSVLPWHPRGRA